MICTPFGTTVPSGSTSAFVLVFEQTNNAERVVAHAQPVLSAVRIHSQMAKLKAIRFGGPTVHSALPKAQPRWRVSFAWMGLASAMVAWRASHCVRPMAMPYVLCGLLHPASCERAERSFFVARLRALL